MRVRRGIVVVVAAVAMCVVPLTGADAVIAPSTFEGNDGDLVAGAGMKDWDNIGVAPIADSASGGGDNSLNGAEDDTSVRVTLGNVQPNKSDLTSFRIATEKVGSPAEDFLYVAWSRVPDPSGNVNIDFELNQLDQGPVPTADNSVWNLKRSAGDKMITFDLVGGGSVPELGLLTWLPSAVPGGNADDDCFGQPNSNGPCWGGRKVLNPTSSPAAEAAVGNVGADVVFGEASINLQAAGIFRRGTCTNYGSTYVKSRSSGSGFQAQLSDFIAPTGVTVSNCGGLTVVKNTGAPSENGTFTFDIDCSNNAFDRTGQQITTIGGTGSLLVPSIPNGTTCSVAERTLAGWTLVGSTPSPASVTIAGNKTITFTNSRDKGSIAVTKTASGGNGTFSFSVACPQVPGYPRTLTVTTTNGTGSASTPADIPTLTTCSVTETAQPGVWTISGDARKDVTVAKGTNNVAFANVRDTGKIVVNKTASGGEGTFTFVVACPIAGYPRTVSVTTTAGTGSGETPKDIPTGTSCTVNEQAQASTWSIVGDAERTVVVDGPAAAVAFSNVRRVGSLVVVVNTTGGDGAFPYAVDCDATAYDAAGTITTAVGTGSAPKITSIPTGTVCSVTQAAVPGWTLGTASPQSVTITGDETVTFQNDRNINTIQIDKSAAVDSAKEGDPVTYNYVVTSTGPDQLRDVSVVDDRCGPVTEIGGDTDNDRQLDPGETWTYRCVAAADSGHPKNIATVTAFDPAGAKLQDTDEVTIAVVQGVVLLNPSVSLTAGNVTSSAASEASLPAAPGARALAGIPLPRTGSAFVDLVLLAGSLILLGLSLLFVSRRTGLV